VKALTWRGKENVQVTEVPDPRIEEPTDASIEVTSTHPVASKLASAAEKVAGLMPDAVPQQVTDKAGVDRLDALYAALKGVRRGGMVSISGVYGGEVDPLPRMQMFDRGIQVRMGQAQVHRWIGELMPIVMDDADPLRTLQLATHYLPLADAPRGYEMFRAKEDGCIKVVLQP
jgi:threonine dehydrogenase-like Zn-dependent dehydrogenase